MKCSIAGLVVLLLAACAAKVPEVDPDYRIEIEQWRMRRVERLTVEDGWLTVVGLHWLSDGVNRFGSNPESEIVLDGPGVPSFAGTIELTENGSVVARASADAGVTINGEPLVEAALATDVDGQPDVLRSGRLSFYVIDRGGKLAVRVKDPDSEARQHFAGIEYFPIDGRYRVTATLDSYPEPREVEIPTVTGDPSTMLAPGRLHFTVDGQELAIEPYVGSPEDDSYFLIFRDRTSGDSTYGGGRFLGAEAVGANGTTVIDFNYAYNPPCAYTAFATCPLPPPQNSLPVPIEAGEKFAGH